jgi:hypothetical protein
MKTPRGWRCETNVIQLRENVHTNVQGSTVHVLVYYELVPLSLRKSCLGCTKAFFPMLLKDSWSGRSTSSMVEARVPGTNTWPKGYLHDSQDAPGDKSRTWRNSSHKSSLSSPKVMRRKWKRNPESGAPTNVHSFQPPTPLSNDDADDSDDVGSNERMPEFESYYK